MTCTSSSRTQSLAAQRSLPLDLLRPTCRILHSGVFKPALPTTTTRKACQPLSHRGSDCNGTSPRLHARLYICASASAAGASPTPAPSSSASTPPIPYQRVLLPTALALLLCNMDRICLSVAILPMSAEFGWPASMQGVIQSAFLWGYAATQLAGGALADRLGGKRVMAAGLAWFSVASLLLPAALTPATQAAGLTVPLVLAARFLTGFGEGVALPCMSNLVAAYVPPAAKARALGLCFSGFHSGNLAGLVLSPLLLAACGWRGLFYVFGALGLPLLLLWMRLVPDAPPPPPSPALYPSSTATPAAAALAPAVGTTAAPDTEALQPDAVSAASLTQQQQERAASAAAAGPGPASGSSGSSNSSTSSSSSAGVSAARMLSSSATWAIIIVNVVNHFGYFIYLNWMPTYFYKALGFDLRSSSFTAFLPWLVMAVGSSAAGVLADSLIARGVSVTTVRKSMQTVALLVPAVALLLLAQPGISPPAAVACMTVALGTTSLGQAGFVANMSDVAPRHAGKMFGLCNTFGCAAGIVGVTAVGFVVEATRSFAPVFLMTAALYVVGAIAWNVWCTTERVFE